MPARSKILNLPVAVQGELDQRLLRGGFQGYEALSNWLSERGYSIGKSSLHRHGEKLKTKWDASLQEVLDEQAWARAIVGEDDGSALRRVQNMEMTSISYRLSQRIKQAEAALDDEADPSALIKQFHLLAQSSNKLQQSGMAEDSWAMRQVEKAIKERGEQAIANAERKGVSPDGIDALRAAIMGAL